MASVTAALRLLDHPNARSLHQQPAPRTGGLAVLAGISVGLLLMMLVTAGAAVPTLGFILAGLAPLTLVSLLDDRKRRPRQVAHLSSFVRGCQLDGGWLCSHPS